MAPTTYSTPLAVLQPLSQQGAALSPEREILPPSTRRVNQTTWISWTKEKPSAEGSDLIHSSLCRIRTSGKYFVTTAAFSASICALHMSLRRCARHYSDLADPFIFPHRSPQSIRHLFFTAVPPPAPTPTAYLLPTIVEITIEMAQ